MPRKMERPAVGADVASDQLQSARRSREIEQENGNVGEDGEIAEKCR